MSVPQPLPFNERRPPPFVAWLLHRANAHPPQFYDWRAAFYSIKERLCERYGNRDGHDWQRITKDCWRCSDHGFSTDCWKCGGTGFWSDRWHLLERWRLGPYTFHRPVDSWTREPDGWSGNLINGRITHDHCSRDQSAEATLWLALLYDRRLWWDLTRNCHCGHWTSGPLSCLCRILHGPVRACWRVSDWVRNRFFRRCEYCGRRITRDRDWDSWLQGCSDCLRTEPPF